jgi:hypothetical protein
MSREGLDGNRARQRALTRQNGLRFVLRAAPGCLGFIAGPGSVARALAACRGRSVL